MTLFWVVVLATTWIGRDMLLLACIPPVFVAIVMGFTMGLYALTTFGVAQAAVSVAAAWLAARELGRRYRHRDLLIAIYLVWALALLFGSIAVGFPDPA